MAAFGAECYAKMLEMKSRNLLAYCSGWTVEISAPACNKEREDGEKRERSSTSSVYRVFRITRQHKCIYSYKQYYSTVQYFILHWFLFCLNLFYIHIVYFFLHFTCTFVSLAIFHLYFFLHYFYLFVCLNYLNA